MVDNSHKETQEIEKSENVETIIWGVVILITLGSYINNKRLA